MLASSGIVSALLFPTCVAAQETDAGVCQQNSATKIISVLICPAKVSLEEMVEAGKAACGERLPSGAWVWSDAEAAPATAPENHAGLTEAQVTGSKGVWVAEKSQFVSIEPVK